MTTIGVMVLLLLAAPVHADDKPAPEPAKKESHKAPEWLAKGYVYSPKDCEFTITFPEEPYKTQHCDPIEPTKNCTDMTSFTKVFGLDATVTYSVTCTPADPGMYEKYDDNVMRTTLIGMAKPVNLDKSETGFGELKEAKMAVLLGSGKAENKKDDLIYTAQLWIGHKSVFTLEGELRGKYSPEADTLFAEILRTAQVKGPVTAVDKPVKDDKSKADKSTDKADDSKKVDSSSIDKAKP